VDNVVLGNYIGLNIDGNALPNQNGIQITGLSENNIIGGSSPNIISGNTSSGIIINGENALNNTIIGNTIGLNTIGNASIPNNTGVFIFNAGGNRIGGNTASERNIISGNSNNGINISDAKGSPNRVLGNYIGTDITGKVAISNSRGINLAANGGSVIGGSEPGEGNIISGNNFDGIAVNSSRDNIILGNQIGVSGSDALPNGQNGILIFSNSTDNVIGGISAGEGNVIAFNISRGVVIIRGPGTVDPVRNRVSGNSIFSNAIVGIDLGEFWNYTK
jgi:trimeric autotransporter adhesin